MNKRRAANCFFTGALIYPLVELAWRRRTHPLMSLAGGCSLMAVGAVSCMDTDRISKCLLSSCAISVLELTLGLIFNKDRHIWDYSKLRFNFKGQICLKYFLYWAILCYIPVRVLEK